ncbi:MAG TPA: hypothetical protein VND64_01050 [Pirellulales bacterium]|nr:hypothetical protein [Pirellulales bacterium]
MTRITLDAETRAKLLNLIEPLDLCDETGRVLGTYTPLAFPEDDDEPQLSDEELRRRAQGPGYTTDEVIAYLESL